MLVAGAALSSSSRSLGRGAFAIVLYVVLLALAGLNVAPIETPKLGGRWYYAVIVYALVLSAVYGWQLR